MAYTGTGTESDPYLVDNFSDFVTCAGISGAYVKIISDIHADGVSVEQIQIRAAKIYADTQKTISDFSTITYALFTSYGSTASVLLENLIFSQVSVENSEGATVFRGYSGKRLVMTNCQFDITVSGTTIISYLDYCAQYCDFQTSYIKIQYRLPSFANSTLGNIFPSTMTANESLFEILDAPCGSLTNSSITGTFILCTIKLSLLGSSYLLNSSPSTILSTASRYSVLVLSITWQKTVSRNFTFYVNGYYIVADTQISNASRVYMYKNSGSGNFFLGLPTADIQSKTYLESRAFITDETRDKWLFDDAFYGYPHVVRLTNNPYNIYLGELNVDEIYIGEELIWKNDGVNKIIINSLEGS